MTDITIATNTK